MAHIKKEKISVNALQVGMYVCELDRPWTSTSFPLQGFYIRSFSSIEQLQEVCQHVFIDIQLTLEWERKRHLETVSGKLDKPKFKSEFSVLDRKRLKRTVYENQTELLDELSTAEAALSNLKQTYKAFCTTLNQPNEIQAKRFKDAAFAVIDSVIRNPGAMLWLCAVNQSTNRLLNHSMRCMVFAAALGRRIGLIESELKTAAFGALLMDIGKVLYPKELIDGSRPLTDAEFEHLKGHVEKSMKIASLKRLLTNTELKVIAHHHEKYDGSGFPAGLSGNMIHLHARIATIVDHYTGIVTPRASVEPISPAEAQNRIYKLKGKEVQSELIEEFIQSIGLYPAASLVELQSGEVATVLTANPKHKLSPIIIILLNENKQWLKKYELVDLSKNKDKIDSQGRRIKKALEIGAFGITTDVLKSINLARFVKAAKIPKTEKKRFWQRG
ncbi:MAG: DUF3391 domain-containing protein [Gammaproteobacteria bacterium]|nr:DUF3391 domain-containing protein [Gammaproteobacteria bacterium]